MDAAMRPCPACRAELEVGLRSGLTTWECPSGHGIGLLVTEAYGRLQRDEIEAIWNGAKGAPVTELISPISGQPMVEVSFVADEDTRFGNDVGESKVITIEVDPDNYFGWFSQEELDAMPFDESGRAPARLGLVGLQQMDEVAPDQDRFFNSLDESDYDDSEDRGGSFFGALARRLRG